MKLPQELTDTILQGVVEKVMDELTPGDDTPDDGDNIQSVVKKGISPDQDKDTGVMGVMMNALSGSGGSGLMDMLGGLFGGGKQQEAPQQQQQSSAGGIMDMLGGLFGGGKQQEEPQQQTQQESSAGGIMDMLGGLFGGGKQQEEPQQQTQQESSTGGIMDMLGGLFGGGKQQEAPQQQQTQQQSSGGGLMDILGGMLGGGTQTQRAAAAKSSGLLETIKDAIGGEGAVGELMETVLKGKGITASNLAENPSLTDKVKNIVIDLIKDFVVDKVQANLMQDKSQGGSLNLNKIIDLLTPDN